MTRWAHLLASAFRRLVQTAGSEYGCETFAVASASTNANYRRKRANLGANPAQQWASATPMACPTTQRTLVKTSFPSWKKAVCVLLKGAKRGR